MSAPKMDMTPKKQKVLVELYIFKHECVRGVRLTSSNVKAPVAHADCRSLPGQRKKRCSGLNVLILR